VPKQPQTKQTKSQTTNQNNKISTTRYTTLQKFPEDLKEKGQV